MTLVFRLTPAAAAALLLASCGGSTISDPVNDPTVVKPTSGYAVDGYLNGATALCDSNGNGIADAGEATVNTDATGLFTFPAGCTAGVVVQGGTNVDTGLPFKGVLKAPAGATVASPLTTLLVGGMTQAQINAALGLPAGTDLANTDPALKVNGGLANADLLKKSLAIEQLVQKTTDILAGLAGAAGDSVLQSIYSEVIASFADVLKGGAVLNSGTTLDQALVGNLVKAATQRVGQAAGVSSEVKAAIGTVNADALAQVTSGALKAQAESILKAADGDITSVTKAKQSDDSIAAFVKTNIGPLAAAPNTATAALAATLTAMAAPAATGGGSTGGGTTGGGTTGGGTTGGGTTGGGTTGGGTTGGGTTGGGTTGGGTTGGGTTGGGTTGGGTTGGGTTGGTVPISLIFASGYSNPGPNLKSVEGGSAGTFVDPGVAPAYNWGGASLLTDANPNFYFGFGFKGTGAKATYFGAFVNAPHDGSVNVAAYTSLDLSVWGNPELIATKPTFVIGMNGPAVSGCGSNSGASELTANITPAAGPADGSTTTLAPLQIPLTAFTLKYACSGETTVAQVLASIHSVSISALGSNIQYVTADKTGAYPNGMNIGRISFSGTTTASPPPAATDYLAMAGDSLRLVNGSASPTTYTMADFQSAAGISVVWPMPSPMTLKATLSEVGHFTLPAGQKVSAAVSIKEMASGRMGEIKAYIDNVAVTKIGSSLEVSVAPGAKALAYVVASDGTYNAIVDFGGGVAGVGTTLTTASGYTNSLNIGNVVNYMVNQVSNQFSMYSLRGKYEVKIVLSDLPLRKSDGSRLTGMTITVPTALGPTGAVTASQPVSGYGLQGYITLTD